MRQRSLSRTLTILGVAVAAVTGLGYLAIQPVVAAPDETNRINHPDGFSIILPQGWEKHLTFTMGGKTGQASISGLPVKAEGKVGEFLVTQLSAPMSEEKLRGMDFKLEKFQDQPAWILRKERATRHEHSIFYIFERDHHWYQIGITRAMSEPIEGEPWGDYAQSFRTHQPATQPSVG